MSTTTTGVARPSACTPYDPSYPNYYDYQPSLIAGVAFAVVFGVSALVHTYQAVKFNKKWLFVFVFGASCECVGWALRAYANKCVYSGPVFDTQISILITAPAFIQSGIYVMLICLVPFLDRRSFPIPPKPYLIFCFCLDMTCGTLQAFGGALAAIASGKVGGSALTGTHIMTSGILLQLISTCIFACLVTFIFTRASSVILANKYLLRLCACMVFCLLCMITRGAYRSVELMQGWDGYLIVHEQYAIGLDGVMMALALVVLNILHPLDLMNRARAEDENMLGGKAPSSEAMSATEEAREMMSSRY